MKILLKFIWIAAGLAVATARGEESFDEMVARTTLQYTERVRQAGAELNATRDRITKEKAPQLERMRLAEERAIAAEDAALRFDTQQEQSHENRQRLIKDAELLYKNLSYLNTLAQESLKIANDGMAPGEAPFLAEPLRMLDQQLANPKDNAGGKAAVDVADFMLNRIELSIGGYGATGEAMLAGDNTVNKGVFVFMGPETYFRTDGGATGIVTRGREGATYPTIHQIATWSPESAASFFQGKLASLPADATAGKALQLKETKGNVWQHIRTGGVVAYAIVAVGLFALLLIVQKTVDLSRLSVDTPEAVLKFLRVVANGNAGEARQALASLKPISRELFANGLEHRFARKTVLEENLQSTLLRQRLHFERRLPLLAVIATAAPLMGLLGTVTGMVQTFALITVFGTGNAGKLAGGISEVLVATELGLLVAIPTLVAHGFLSNRIQKQLSLLERYALEFVTATQRDEVVEEVPGR